MWRDFWNIEVGSGTEKRKVYPFGDSTGAESGAEGDSSGETSYVELKGSVIGQSLGSESVTGVGPS